MLFLPCSCHVLPCFAKRPKILFFNVTTGCALVPVLNYKISMCVHGGYILREIEPLVRVVARPLARIKGLDLNSKSESSIKTMGD